MTFFKNIELLPGDPILSLPLLFAVDSHEKKVNLGVGTYQDAEGKPRVLEAVKKAEEKIFSLYLDKEYQPIEGLSTYLQPTIELIYGRDYPSEKLRALHSIGGTGALRVAADFFVRQGHHIVYLSDPTWPNHKNIFQSAGMTLHEYPYYNYSNGELLFKEMCVAIKKMEKGSVIVLQACCHNPTGLDLSKEQWIKISELIKEHQIIPLFDNAYQGLGLSLEDDAWPIRHFVSQGHEMFVANSYSKNMGLYGERLGTLSWIAGTEDISIRILSHLRRIIRGIYSTPNLHGARLVSQILGSPQLKREWVNELEQMRLRIIRMRKLLVESLNNKQTGRDFSFMEMHHGMFSLLGLNPNQIEKLKNDFGVYMLSNSRINIAGLIEDNVDYVAQSIATVLKHEKNI